MHVDIDWIHLVCGASVLLRTWVHDVSVRTPLVRNYCSRCTKPPTSKPRRAAASEEGGWEQFGVGLIDNTVGRCWWHQTCREKRVENDD